MNHGTRTDESSTVHSYEFSVEENSLIADLAGKMKGVAVFLYLLGTVGMLGTVASGWRSRFDLAIVLILGTAFLFAVATWTFWAGKSFRKIVDTEGHDIPHTMVALAQLRRFYTLHFWLILLYVGLIVLAILGYPQGLG